MGSSHVLLPSPLRRVVAVLRAEQLDQSAGVVGAVGPAAGGHLIVAVVLGGGEYVGFLCPQGHSDAKVLGQHLLNGLTGLLILIAVGIGQLNLREALAAGISGLSQLSLSGLNVCLPGIDAVLLCRIAVLLHGAEGAAVRGLAGGSDKAAGRHAAVLEHLLHQLLSVESVGHSLSHMYIVKGRLVHIEVQELSSRVGADDHVGILGHDLGDLLGGKMIHHVDLASLVGLVSRVVVGDDDGADSGDGHSVCIIVVGVLLEQHMGSNLVFLQHERSVADTGLGLLLPALSGRFHHVLLDGKVHVVGNQLREERGHVLQDYLEGVVVDGRSLDVVVAAGSVKVLLGAHHIVGHGLQGLGGEGRIADSSPGELKIMSRHRISVGPLCVLSQMEGVGFSVLRYIPGLSHTGLISVRGGYSQTLKQLFYDGVRHGLGIVGGIPLLGLHIHSPDQIAVRALRGLVGLSLALGLPGRFRLSLCGSRRGALR